VAVEMRATVATGMMTGVPGVKTIKLQEGGVITSERSGSSGNSATSVPPFGFSSESMLTGTSHARPGLIAICAVHRRHINPNNNINKNSNRSRRSRSLSSALSRSRSRSLCGSCAAMSMLFV
jgi:hypothetical protein